MYKIYIFMFIG